MKKVIALFISFSSFSLSAQTPADDPTWQLVFTEDFNILDPNIWTTQNQFNCWGAYAAVMLPSNVSIQSGNLVLTLQRETNYYCPNCVPHRLIGSTATSQNFDFSGAWVNSKNENFHYGYYEMRVKMDYRPGFWPALWMLNSSVKPHYSEIDIAEMIGAGKVTQSGIPNQVMAQNKYTTNLHGKGSPNISVIDNGLSDYKEVDINDYTQYHIYSFDWQPNRMLWYIDGMLVRSTVPFEPFDVSMTMIFDVHIQDSLAQKYYGGNNPFTPDYPAKMYVDYFKYYQLKGNCTPAINTCNYNFPSHINTTKQQYDIGGYGCSDVVPIGQPYVFRASNYVQLNSGFEVPVGATFLADANPYCLQNTYATTNCGLVFNPCDFDFSAYVNDVKNFIEISGANCQAIVKPTDNIIMKAIEYIHLKEGFSVPIGSAVDIKIAESNGFKNSFKS